MLRALGAVKACFGRRGRQGVLRALGAVKACSGARGRKGVLRARGAVKACSGARGRKGCPSPRVPRVSVPPGSGHGACAVKAFCRAFLRRSVVRF